MAIRINLRQSFLKIIQRKNQSSKFAAKKVYNMTNQFTHIADVKVGKVKGKSRIYPQLRLPSQYAELAGKKASIYEISGYEGDVAFVIRFDGFETQGGAAYHERAERAEGHNVPAEPCRGSDSGSNPDSGAPFLV
jgi:hypothetical protein